MTRTEQAAYQQGIDARNRNESIDSYPGYLTPALRAWWKAGWMDTQMDKEKNNALQKISGA